MCAYFSKAEDETEAMKQAMKAAINGKKNHILKE